MNSSKSRIWFREGPQRLRKQSTSKLVKLKQKKLPKVVFQKVNIIWKSNRSLKIFIFCSYQLFQEAILWLWNIRFWKNPKLDAIFAWKLSFNKKLFVPFFVQILPTLQVFWQFSLIQLFFLFFLHLPCSLYFLHFCCPILSLHLGPFLVKNLIILRSHQPKLCFRACSYLTYLEIEAIVYFCKS